MLKLEISVELMSFKKFKPGKGMKQMKFQTSLKN
jgi:hypothetical protein